MVGTCKNTLVYYTNFYIDTRNLSTRSIIYYIIIYYINRRNNCRNISLVMDYNVLYE